MKFLIWLDADEMWRVSLVGGNGETVFTTQGYTRRRDAKRAVRAMKMGVVSAPTIDG